MRAMAAALALTALSLGAIGKTTAIAQLPAAPDVPDVRFLFGDAAELLETAYPDRYRFDAEPLGEDVDWARGNAEDLTGWWRGQGRLFLQRLEDLTGLGWPHRQIDVYLVRYWPVISIERPLVLALDAVRPPASRETPVPRDRDVRALLLAHQLAHYLLDVPEFLPQESVPDAYGHPLLAPGNYAVEAMINWVVYTALGELWGEERLEAAASNELWRAYNPNHEFVVDELAPRHRLSRLATLIDWLAANPEGSEIFRIREAYLERPAMPVDAPAVRERVTGSDYGLDLAASYEGRVFAAYVDSGSPAARAGLLEGDLLVTVEGRAAPTDVIAAQAALDASWEENREINLSVEREGRELFFAIQEP